MAVSHHQPALHILVRRTNKTRLRVADCLGKLAPDPHDPIVLFIAHLVRNRLDPGICRVPYD
jgi:hypothetical protein